MLRNALIATAALVGLPGLAVAEPVTGLYIGGGAGLNILQDTDLSLSGPVTTGPAAAPRAGRATFDSGFGGVLSLGWGFGNGVRAEIEGSYRQNDVDKATGFAGAAAPLRAGGTARTYGVMANALYDFDLGPGAPVVPYLGVGAGFLWHDYDNVRVTANGQPLVGLDGNQGRFAYQAIAGLAVPVSAVPGLAVTAEYRFTGTLQHEIDARADRPGLGLVRGTAEVDDYNHAILVGLRYAFGAPTPPPVAAPVAPAIAAAPAPARTYLVFFDFDRADLTDRARQIIADAAQASRSVQTTRIEVAGHADRSGTPQYNQRLSERRAEAVAAELVRLGVSRSEIVTQAFGETRPLVPTADGVREPQNRRVEIVLR